MNCTLTSPILTTYIFSLLFNRPEAISSLLSSSNPQLSSRIISFLSSSATSVMNSVPGFEDAMVEGLPFLFHATPLEAMALVREKYVKMIPKVLPKLSPLPQIQLSLIEGLPRSLRKDYTSLSIEILAKTNRGEFTERVLRGQLPPTIALSAAKSIGDTESVFTLLLRLRRQASAYELLTEEESNPNFSKKLEAFISEFPHSKDKIFNSLMEKPIGISNGLLQLESFRDFIMAKTMPNSPCSRLLPYVKSKHVSIENRVVVSRSVVYYLVEQSRLLKTKGFLIANSCDFCRIKFEENEPCFLNSALLLSLHQSCYKEIDFPEIERKYPNLHKVLGSKLLSKIFEEKKSLGVSPPDQDDFFFEIKEKIRSSDPQRRLKRIQNFNSFSRVSEYWNQDHSSFQFYN